MANLSTAFGTIEFSSNNKDVLEILYNSLYRMKGEYTTDFMKKFDTTKIKMYENRYAFTSEFCATGRWTYLNNISYYPNWMQVNEQEEAILQENEWKITYDFADEESGNIVLYHALVEVSHPKNTDLKELYSVQDITDYEYSWVNIVRLGFYESIEDYVTNNYWFEGDEEYFLEDFTRNKEELAQYLDCDIDDTESILRKSGLSEIYSNAKSLIKE